MENKGYVNAVDPTGQNKPPLRLKYAQRKVSQIRQLGFRGAIKEAVELVSFTLTYPNAVFCGLRPPDDKHSGNSPGWLCYCANPPYDYAPDGELCNPDPSKVFLVFVNEDRMIFEWRWEDADIESICDKEYLPRNHCTRFSKGRLL